MRKATGGRIIRSSTSDAAQEYVVEAQHHRIREVNNIGWSHKAHEQEEENHLLSRQSLFSTGNRAERSRINARVS